jgi:hypothetical protein
MRRQLICITALVCAAVFAVDARAQPATSRPSASADYFDELWNLGTLEP